jgi:hypothetical protein
MCVCADADAGACAGASGDEQTTARAEKLASRKHQPQRR